MAKNYRDVNYFDNRPDVVKIFDDLDKLLDFCRFEIISVVVILSHNSLF